jgi:hypothetical protein
MTVPTRKLLTLSNDPMSLDQYLEIYRELSGYDPEKNTWSMTLRDFRDKYGPSVSIHIWGRLRYGEEPKTTRCRTGMRNDLRRAKGLPELTAGPNSVLTDGSSSAHGFVIGSGSTEVVVLVGEHRDPVRIDIDGQEVSAREKKRSSSKSRTPIRHTTITVDKELKAALSEVKGDQTWADFLRSRLML